MKRNKKAFTLIELVSVLVILAILALIVTPLVLNIIKKAKNAADRRSVDAYGKALQLAVAGYTIDTGRPPTDLDTLEVEYKGKEVVCAVKQLKENGGLYMSQCTVNGKGVKDSKTDDGWYHYGTKNITDEEYLNMYGDALQAASVAYYQENNSKVSDYRTLEINYTGKEVSCDTQINYDGSIFLENCTVAGNQVENYTYGEAKYRAYSSGDEVSYNNVNYYVIKDSAATDTTVTLLKAEPLTTSEVNQYGVGHINRYTRENKGTAYDDNGYGGVAYYSSYECGFYDKYDNNKYNTSGCITNYEDSDIKYIVDAWAEDKVSNGLVEARLITIDELIMEEYEICTQYQGCYTSTKAVSYQRDYKYWTMSPNEGDMASQVWYVRVDGAKLSYTVYNSFTVRPVIIINKSVLN